MPLIKTHGFYDYSAIRARPAYDWPNRTRLAVHLALNLEYFRFGDGLSHNLSGPDPWPNHPNYAWCDYGNRVGVWRLLDLLDEMALPAALLINSAIYEVAPEIPAAFRARGDEMVGHGRTNSERQADMTREQEAACIREATETIARHEGRAPAGWLGPWRSQSRHTLDLLKEAGYRYMMDWPVDDQPFWFRTRHGPILSVPYPSELNDSLAMIRRADPPEVYANNVVANFDEMLIEAEKQPLVFGLALHTHVLGQPYRLRHFRRALEHIARHRERIWLARPGAIAAFVEGLPPGIVPGSGAPRA